MSEALMAQGLCAYGKKPTASPALSRRGNKVKVSELLPMWVSDGEKLEIMKMNEAIKVYNSLQNKDSLYAKSIDALIKVRAEIVQIWMNKKREIENGITR